jgi:hypothetical protein
MGRKLDAATLQSVLLDLTNDFPLRAIAKRYRIGRNTVKRIELSMDVYGTPYPPECCVQGRPRLLLKVQEEVRWKPRELEMAEKRAWHGRKEGE